MASGNSSRGILLSGNSTEYKFIVFQSHCPKGCACIRWSMPHVLDVILGRGRDGKWLGRHSKQMLAVLSLFEDAPGDHWRPSAYSLKKQKDVLGEEPPSLPVECLFDAEYSISSKGLLYLLCRWSQLRLQVGHEVESKPEACTNLLRALLHKFLPAGAECSFQVKVEDGSSFQVQMRDGCFIFVGGDRRVGTLRRVLSSCGSMEMVSALVEMGRIVGFTKKYKAILPVALATLRTFAAAFFDTVELSRDDVFWKDCDGMELEPLQRTDSRRCRRIPMLFRKAVFAAVQGDKQVKSVGELLAAKRLLAGVKAKSRGLKVVKKSVDSKWADVQTCKTLRLQYMSGTLETMRGSKWAHPVVGASRIGGVDWLMVLFWGSRAGKAAWFPPQAGNCAQPTGVSRFQATR
ncbi:unnamed protein product [Prorocentrum cordatum]|uniref:RNA-directed RNA polymerase n=1 Tax=Prorocentrum cordatum TaxID=2364126 RepID=A0ABN9RKL0_9DINO|nr:unnamed protein product [Polarella glacialis]